MMSPERQTKPLERLRCERTATTLGVAWATRAASSVERLRSSWATLVRSWGLRYRLPPSGTGPRCAYCPGGEAPQALPGISADGTPAFFAELTLLFVRYFNGPNGSTQNGVYLLPFGINHQRLLYERTAPTAPSFELRSNFSWLPSARPWRGLGRTTLQATDCEFREGSFLRAGSWRGISVTWRGVQRRFIFLKSRGIISCWRGWRGFLS